MNVIQAIEAALPQPAHEAPCAEFLAAMEELSANACQAYRAVVYERGFGSAVKAWLAAHPEPGLSLLQAMATEWPFFQTLLSNMDMVLAKSDIAIASRYKQLVDDVGLRESVFARLCAEWQASVDALLAILEQRVLLERNPLLARNIRNRFPYIDPLNYVQLELLRRYRSGDVDERVVQGIHLTINGIAAGLRNSG